MTDFNVGDKVSVSYPKRSGLLGAGIVRDVRIKGTSAGLRYFYDVSLNTGALVQSVSGTRLVLL
jgi:hypothetical protein